MNRQCFCILVTIGLTLAGCGGGSSTSSDTSSNVPSVLVGGAIQGKALQLSATVTTFSGSHTNSGSTDGTGSTAAFNGLAGITTDGTNLYAADSGNHTIRKIVISTGVVTTIAGSAGTTGSGDGIGSAARFNGPDGITTDGTSLYVADAFNCIIRKIVLATGAVTTIAGSAYSAGHADGSGTAARFNYPTGITTDGTSLYVSEPLSKTIRKIAITSGTVTTIVGSTSISRPATMPLGLITTTAGGTNVLAGAISNPNYTATIIGTTIGTTISDGFTSTPALPDGSGTAITINPGDTVTIIDTTTGTATSGGYPTSTLPPTLIDGSGATIAVRSLAMGAIITDGKKLYTASGSFIDKTE